MKIEVEEELKLGRDQEDDAEAAEQEAAAERADADINSSCAMLAAAAPAAKLTVEEIDMEAARNERINIGLD